MTTLIIYISADIFDLEIVQMSRVCVTVGSFQPLCLPYVPCDPKDLQRICLFLSYRMKINCKSLIWFNVCACVCVSKVHSCSYPLTCLFYLFHFLFLSCLFSANGPFSRIFFSYFFSLSEKSPTPFFKRDASFTWLLLFSLEMAVGWVYSLLTYGPSICHYALCNCFSILFLSIPFVYFL